MYNDKRIVSIIEARMRSTRLPGKVMKPILDEPMLYRMIERLQNSNCLDDIWIATTDHESCTPIIDLATRMGVGCFEGSEDDVLDRVLKTAKRSDADIIVELTGDCPLMDHRVVDRIVGAFLTNNIDYCSNALQEDYPGGMDVQVFPIDILREVAELASDPIDREHVSLYIYEHPDQYRILDIKDDLSSNLNGIRLTVDTDADFQLVSKIFEELYYKNPLFSLEDIFCLFDQKPELRNINKHIQQKNVR